MIVNPRRRAARFHSTKLFSASGPPLGQPGRASFGDAVHKQAGTMFGHLALCCLLCHVLPPRLDRHALEKRGRLF